MRGQHERQFPNSMVTCTSDQQQVKLLKLALQAMCEQGHALSPRPGEVRAGTLSAKSFTAKVASTREERKEGKEGSPCEFSRGALVGR